MRKRKANFGSVISATLRPEDTIPAFYHELRAIRGSVPIELWTDIRKALADDEYMEDNGLEIANDLIDALNEHAPDYGYFGANSADCADFGFWLSDEWEERAREEGLFVSDTSEVPSDYTGEVFHVTDHGNVTLYSARKGKLTEVWSVV